MTTVNVQNQLSEYTLGSPPRQNIWWLQSEFGELVGTLSDCENYIVRISVEKGYVFINRVDELRDINLPVKLIKLKMEF